MGDDVMGPLSDGEKQFLLDVPGARQDMFDPLVKARARRHLAELAEQSRGKEALVDFMLIENDELDGLTPAQWLAVGRPRDMVDALVRDLDRDP